MQVTLRYFAAAREAAGLDAEAFEVEAATTAAGLLDAACRRRPGLAPLRGHLRLAVGTEFVDPETPLSADAVVALIPPVAGG